MKKILYTLAIATLLVGCSKSENTLSSAPALDKISGLPSDTTVAMGENIRLEAVMSYAEQAKYEWTIDGTKISDQQTADFKPSRTGRHTLVLKMHNLLGSTQESFNIDVFRPVTKTSSKWISQLIDYRPAPGQFVNTGSANQAAAESIISKRGLVSLGAWGGYIEFGFDHTVKNHTGVDFVIHGNAFEGNSEAGIVMVAYDANGNSKADADEWFELKGSDYDRAKRDYSLTYIRPASTDKAEDVAWSDNNGATGAVVANSFHLQCYYPLFLADNPAKLTFQGSRLPDNATQDENGIWSLSTFASGYADNASADYSTVVAGDRETANSNKFEIDNAIDSKGQRVRLKGIDFVRVSNGLCQQAGWLGDSSTEVCGAISLSVVAAQR